MALVVNPYVEGMRARQTRGQAARALAVESVRAKLGQVSSLLTDKYGVTRVVLFGSFARGDVREDSDVDLLVEGLSSEGYFAAAADVSCLLRRDADLVRLEDAGPLLLERVARQGIVISD